MASAGKIKKPSVTAQEKVSVSTVVTSHNLKTPAALLGIMAVLLYLPTIRHGFVLDDGLVTTINEYVKRGFAGLGDIFSHGYRAGATITTDSDYMYRPLSVMMFAAEWHFFPNQAWIHHLVNVIFYGLTAVAVFMVFVRVSGPERIDVAFLTALLFVVHPIHAEVVSNIKSRDEIMSLFFGAITLLFTLKALSGGYRPMVISALSFFLALLSKEGAVTMLAIVPLAIYFFTGKNPLRYVWPLLLVFFFWFLLRKHYMGPLDYIPDPNDNQLVRLNFAHRSATAMRVLLDYLRLLAYPHPLSWDYSYQQVQDTDWSSPGPLASLAIHAALLVIALTGLSKRKWLSFFILSYFASMALYSNLFFLIGTIMGERLAYMASLWFCAAVVWLAADRMGYANPDARWLAGRRVSWLYSLCLLFVVLLGYKTVMRSKDWKSSFSLFLKDVDAVPESFRAHQALADESLQLYLKKYANPVDSAKYLSLAQTHYEASGKILKTFSNQVGLGNVFLFRNEYAAALESFKSARELNDNKVARERLATTYYQYGRYEAQVGNNLPKAEELISQAYQLDSSQAEVLTDLGMVYGLQQKFQPALDCFTEAYRIDPKNQTIVNNLVRTYILLGRQSAADSLIAQSKLK